MKRCCCLCLAAMAILTSVAAAPAAVFYVDAANSSGTELGTQQNPFRTVQAAIDAAAGNDTIRVAAGTYVQNLRIQNKPLVLEGGYSSGWVRDLAANTTTLSGPGGNAVVNLIGADATIDGFRITGGTGSTEELPYSYRGGGIYSRDGSPTISNNVIEGNDIRSVDPPSDYNLGGGVYVTDAATATIVNNVVRGNYAGRGAGLAVIGPAALIRGNTIENNVAVGDHGGGLFIAVTNATITQNLIRRNEVGRALGYGWGGGLIVVNPNNFAELSFNVLYENFAAAYGAAEFIDEGARANIHHELIYRNVSKEGCEGVSAIAVDGGEGVGSQAAISHCTVVNNPCATSFRGNGLQVEGLSVVSVVNSIFWNNGGDDFRVDDTSTLTVTYTDSQEAIGGTGNISADPLFVNAAADDYQLAAGSPCIDAGDPASPFNNEPPDNGGRADMGRYGNAADALRTGGSGGGGTDGSGGSGDGGSGSG
ncbi:MAG: right-handed parallel beta-helix repeat-containing protein, partial [Phycisphaerae bacterium]